MAVRERKVIVVGLGRSGLSGLREARAMLIAGGCQAVRGIAAAAAGGHEGEVAP
jgi:hypothetical protein